MPSVLVTGASRGIGRAVVVRLAQAGWDVYAGLRRPEDGAALTAEAGGRVTPVVLDITDDKQLAALDDVLPAALDAVVNNAGIAVGGPLEGLSLDDLRRQLEVNVVGQVAVTQAVLPRIRSARGRIVMVSSLSGRVVTPLTGAYNASKFALEAVADALRLELHPWGIKVAVVQPAQTDTDMWRKAEEEADRSEAALAPEHRELYAGHIAGMRRAIPRSQKMAVPVDDVARVVMTALTSRRPKPRYVVGVGPRAQLTAAQLLPTRVLDAALRKASGLPGRPPSPPERGASLQTD